MEITIEQNVYPRSGTKEVLCMVATREREHIYNKTYGISKLGICYQFNKMNAIFKLPYELVELDGDTVLDPVNITQEDW